MPAGSKLRVWVVQQGEPVIFHPAMKDAKPMRATLLACELARRGHDVIWWTSAFEHYTKRHLQPAGILQETDIPGLRYCLVPSPGYRRNISLARMRDHAILARNWEVAVAERTPPDIIVASYPVIDLAHAAVRYAKRRGVPVVVDVRDMWPDIIYDRLRRKLHLPFLPPILRGYERMARHVFSEADAIMGITDAFVDWALRRAGRPRSANDRAFPLSSPPLRDLAPEEEESAAGFWRERLPGDFEKRTTFAWVGTLLDTRVTRAFLKAVAALPPDVAQRTCLVVCGRGSLEKKVHAAAGQHEHIVYAGWVDRANLAYLLSRIDHGVIPYERTMDFQASVPNKVGEYLSAGAQVLTTLDGQVRTLLEREGVVRTISPTFTGMRDTLMQVVAAGKVPEAKRARARDCYHRLFDSRIVYPAMAEHVERLAACHGK